MSEKDLISVAEARELLRIARAEMYHILSRGELALYRLSDRRSVVKRADVRDLLRRRAEANKSRTEEGR